MNLEHDFLQLMSELGQDLHSSTWNADQIISVIDLTLLNLKPEPESIVHLQHQLKKYPVAAVCVFPALLEELQVPSNIKKATVVNFPEGMQSSAQVCQEIHHILAQHAVDEIDYVFPQPYSPETQPQALLHCQQAFQLCKSHNITFKVILETGSIPSANEVYTLSRRVIEQGCDFLKTSTGKTSIGATPLAAYAMLRAIHDAASPQSCGLKVSGGINRPEQAWLYMQLVEHCLNRPAHKDRFRIGASSLLDRTVQRN